jgi:hypothetical protein
MGGALRGFGPSTFFDAAALVGIKKSSAFTKFFALIANTLARGQRFLHAQQPWLNKLSGGELGNVWRETCHILSAVFETTDRK